MNNTFGIRSVNTGSFNIKPRSSAYYPKHYRDIVILGLKIHNLILNVIGYIPLLSSLSGCLRIVTGGAMCGVTLVIGERNAKRGYIIGHWYDEALLTGTTQVMRGFLEALIPFGKMVNFSLDIVGTVSNIKKEVEAATPSYLQRGLNVLASKPHPNPTFDQPDSLLYYA